MLRVVVTCQRVVSDFHGETVKFVTKYVFNFYYAWALCVGDGYFNSGIHFTT